ncbi:hypothetical protein Mapa_000323 [Marchantia paleacea]|nr:hypothetical protein Mapa_000323 [Marchantia paleacea]
MDYYLPKDLKRNIVLHINTEWLNSSVCILNYGATTSIQYTATKSSPYSTYRNRSSLQF